MVTFPLAYRAPFDAAALFGFLAPRAIPGVEHVTERGYARTVELASGHGIITVEVSRDGLLASLSPSLAGARGEIEPRLRQLFDLDADPRRIARKLARDPTFRELVRARPGLRVPGAFDGFEMAVRAVLGQQVSVRAATTLATRLAARFGRPVVTEHAALSHLFPPASVLAAVHPEELSALGILPARARTLLDLAALAAREPDLLRPGAGPEATMAALTALRGIGDWTAQYVAMRALSHRDAFPAGDLGVRKALGMAPERAVRLRAEPLRPYRAYAVMHLWHAPANPVPADRTTAAEAAPQTGVSAAPSRRSGRARASRTAEND